MTPSFGRGPLADSYTVFSVLAQAVEDFTRRTYPQIAPPLGDTVAGWARRQALFEHLALTADEFWIAEEGGAGGTAGGAAGTVGGGAGNIGAAIGYARSIRRDDMR